MKTITKLNRKSLTAQEKSGGNNQEVPVNVSHVNMTESEREREKVREMKRRSEK